MVGTEGRAVVDDMDERLRVLQVGCGGISRLWLDALRDAPDAEFVGFVDLDPDPDRAHDTARRLGSRAPVGSDLRTMLADVRPAVVFDCTVPEAHRGLALAALEAGCHVFCEKPMADTLASARAMVASAADRGRTLAVMQNRRYDPNVRALRAFLAEGHIGRVTTVPCRLLRRAALRRLPRVHGARLAARHGATPSTPPESSPARSRARPSEPRGTPRYRRLHRRVELAILPDGA